MGHFRILLYIEAQYPWSSKYSFTCGDQWNGLFGVIGSALAENWHMQNKFSSNFSNYGGNAIILLFCSLGARKYDVVDQF